ncbi:MAG TPA: tetratricopeptide repeat protein [Marinobacterium sp.]|nr:tetratricopeptide repeat protein [Marinobacterium sp.]
MPAANRVIHRILILTLSLSLFGCKQVALITASDSTRELSLAADQGDARAAYAVGMRYTQGLGESQDYALGLDYFKTAAELGMREAQYMLGMGYYLGRGVAVDYTQARLWLSAAADQGEVSAMRSLGEIYFNGYGTARAPIKGIYWSLRAAELGDAQAQYLTGVAYLTGLGSNQSQIEGVEWLARASQNGDQRADNLLQTLNLKRRGASSAPKRPLSFHQTRYIQLRLTELGQNPGAIDGLWGDATKHAIRSQFDTLLSPEQAFTRLMQLTEKFR